MKKGLIIVGGLVVLALIPFLWQSYQNSQWLTYTSDDGWAISFPADWELDTSRGLLPGDAILDPEREAFVVMRVTKGGPSGVSGEVLDQVANTVIASYQNSVNHEVTDSEVKAPEGRDDVRLYRVEGTYDQTDGSTWNFIEVGTVLNTGVWYAARGSIEPGKDDPKGSVVEKILTSFYLP
jgi:hypothetical protein